MAKGRLLLVLTVLAAFMFGSAAIASNIVVPVKGPGKITFIIKKHRKIHKRRRHHHRHHKITLHNPVKPVTTGIKPVQG